VAFYVYIIKNVYLLKGYNAKRSIKKVSDKVLEENYTERFLEAITNHRFRGAQGRQRSAENGAYN